MQLINEEIFNFLREKMPMRVAIVHNLTLQEYLYIYLEEEESRNINPRTIRDFIKNSYISHFDDWELTVTFYSKITKPV